MSMTLVITRPTEFRQHSEFAAWYTDLVVPPGEYKLHPEHDRMTAKLPGIVSSKYDATHYGGVTFGSNKKQGINHPNVGQPVTYYWSIYGYQAKYMAQTNATTYYVRIEDEEVT